MTTATSDAVVTQSVTKVERCKYGHNWEETGTIDHAPEGTTTPFIRCQVCKSVPKAKELQAAEAIIHLRKVLKPGDTVYTVLRHVSRSGMSRNIDLYKMSTDGPVWISAYVGHAIGSPQSEKNWQRSQGLTVSGCGMDMGFHLVYNLSRVLYPNGFVCIGEGCGSNDHNNEYRKYQNYKGQMHTGDGGYALRHKWL